MITPLRRQLPGARFALLAGLGLSPFLPTDAEIPAEEADAAIPMVRLADAFLVATRTEQTALDTAASVSRFSAEDFGFVGAKDFDDFLEMEPLVSATFDGSAADPTVAYNSGGAGAYTVRGVGGNRVAILLDGIRQPLEVDFQVGGIAINSAGRDYFDPVIFQSAEIFKGTASSLYGSDALAGVVAFATPDPEDFLDSSERDRFFGYRFQYNSASENFSNVLTGAVREGPAAALLIYARRDLRERDNTAEPVDGYLPEPNPVEGASDSFLAKIDYQLNEAQQLQFSAEGFRRETDIDVRSVERESANPFSISLGGGRLPGVGRTRVEAADSHNQRERFRYSLEYRFEPTGAVFDELRTQIYHQRSSTEDRYSERGRTEWAASSISDFGYTEAGSARVHTAYEENTTGLTANVLRELDGEAGTHRLLFGVEASQGESELPFTSSGSSRIAASSIVGFPEYQQGRVDSFSVDRPRLPATETTRLGLFLQDEFTFGAARQWTAVAGLRIDYYRLDSENDPAFRAFVGADAPDYEDLSLSPSLSLLYRLSDEASLYASYRQGFRNPTPVEISGGFVHPPGADFRTAPNPDLEAEQSYAFEIGAKYRGDGLQLEANLFHTLYDNFINYPTDSGETIDEGERSFNLFKPSNLEAVEVYGYELFAEASLARLSDRFPDWFAGTTLGQAFGKNKENGDYLTTVDPFQWLHYLEYRGEGLRARLSGRYVAAKERLSDPNIIPTEKYYVLDLRVSWDVNDRTTLGFGVDNLTDTRHTRWQSVQNNIHGSRRDQLELFQRVSEPGRNFFVSCAVAF